MLKASDIIEKATIKPGTYEIELAHGMSVTVRRVSDARVFEAIGLSANTIIEHVKKGKFPSEWKPYLPITPKTAQMMVMFSELIVEPKFTLLESLELIHKAGMVALFLYSRIAEEAALMIPTGGDE